MRRCLRLFNKLSAVAAVVLLLQTAGLAIGSSSSSCGDPGVCNCEDGFCTLEKACTCPDRFDKVEVPNTGPNGASVCYACRPGAVMAKHHQAMDFDDDDDEPLNGEPVVGDFDEDDEDEDGDIFGASEDPNGDFDSDDEDGNIFGSGDDDDEEDEDDFGEEKDNGHAADRAAGLSKLQCGGEGVCNCNQNQCTIESTCFCPLGLVKVTLPNTGAIGGEFCFACRTPEEAGKPAVTEEAINIPPGVAVLLLGLLGWFLYTRIMKLRKTEAPKLTRAERLKAHKEAKKNKKKRR